MKTIYADLVDKIALGYQTESDRTQVVFDVTALQEEFPGGLASVAVRGPSELSGHLASGVVQSGNTVIWTVNNFELRRNGSGQVQLIWSVNGAVAKTKVWPSVIACSVPVNGNTMPPDWRNVAVELLEKAGAVSEAIEASNAITLDRERVLPLTDTELTKYITLDVVGNPPYVGEADLAQYAEYGLTETGWYLFARIMAKDGVTVGDGASVEGAKAIITAGADHVDVAVLFDVAAMSQKVVVHWDGSNEDTFVFKATDLAVRNLDYRTTFYVYDLAPFARWTYALTTDATFVAGSHYFVKDGDTYTAAEVQTEAYVLTADATFAAGKTYYTKDGDVYTAATVTAGEAVPADTYYEKTTVPVPAYYKLVDGYVLTSDATFQDGVTYYTKSGDEYVEAEVTVGDAVTANTYYVAGQVYVQAEDGTFQPGVTYYTKSGAEYVEAQVTVGDVCPAYYKHSKVTFEGMTRNVTYVLNDEIDCPSEFILPEIEDETHGCWYECRFHHSGSFSSTLVPPEGVKVATEHTQAETAGVNMVDLHYTAVDGVKIWRFMNTHSSIPA